MFGVASKAQVLENIVFSRCIFKLIFLVKTIVNARQEPILWLTARSLKLRHFLNLALKRHPVAQNDKGQQSSVFFTKSSPM